MGEKKSVSSNVRVVTGTKDKKKEAYFDYGLLTVLVFLICFGLVMLYSTSAYSAMVDYGDSMHYFKRQLVFCVAGFLVMFVVSRINYHYYVKWGKYIYFVSVFAMALVQTPLGIEVNGAKRWIRLPFDQQLQPSEIAKIAVILFIPVLICKLGTEIKVFSNTIRVFLWGAFYARLCISSYG